jgi:transcriptional regulator with XRE-family HTH domain
MKKKTKVKRKYSTEKKNFAVVFSHVITGLRRRQGWNLEEVAKRTGVDKSTICRYESGTKLDVPLHELTKADIEEVAGKIRLPDIYTSHMLATAFGITLDQLIGLCEVFMETARELKFNDKQEHGYDAAVERVSRK